MGRIVVEKVSGWQRVGWSPGWGQRHRVACLATQFNFIGDTAAEQSEQTKTNFELRTNMVAKGETIKGERRRGAEKEIEGRVQIGVHFLLGPVSRVHQLLKRRLLESAFKHFLVHPTCWVS